jgi:MFS family permease
MDRPSRQPLEPPRLRLFGRTQAAAVEAPVPGVRAPWGRLTTFDALRHRDYRLMWIGMLFTSGGMWMETVALNWLVYDMTGSAVQLGILNGLRAVPSLLTGLFGGVAADRMDRKRLMMSTQVLLLLLYLALGLIIVAGLIEVWHLMAFTLATGVVWTFNQPVRQAVLPSLVPQRDLLAAVALQSAAFNVTRVLGPAVGGLLIAWVGAGGAILAEAAAWIAVLIATAMMVVPPKPERSGAQQSVWQDLMDGFRYIGRTRDVLGLIVGAMLPFILIMPYMTMLTIFARDIFNMDAAGLGVLMSVSGIGALAATLGVASLGSFRGKGRLLMWCGYAMCAVLVAFALSPWLALSYLTLILLSGASMAYMALSNTMISLIVPNEFRGRVMSVYMLDRGLMPLGSLGAGLMAAAWGAPAALAVMGATGFVFTAILFAHFANVRRLD